MLPDKQQPGGGPVSMEFLRAPLQQWKAWPCGRCGRDIAGLTCFDGSKIYLETPLKIHTAVSEGEPMLFVEGVPHWQLCTGKT